MAASEPIDLIFWGNIFAGSGLIVYAFYLWVTLRMGFVVPPRIIKFIRWFCFILLCMPIAARLYYPEEMILFLSCAVLAVGMFIKLRKILGS